MDYTLSTLARNLLKQERSELSPSDIPGGCRLDRRAMPHLALEAGPASRVHCITSFTSKCLHVPPHPCAAKYESAAKLLQLVRHAESDAWLALGLAFYLSVLPLTRQLVSRVPTCGFALCGRALWLVGLSGSRRLPPFCRSAPVILCLATRCSHTHQQTIPPMSPAQASLSGSLWGKALLGQRAQRIEMLLLHEFYDKKFLLPDKLSNKVSPGGCWRRRLLCLCRCFHQWRVPAFHGQARKTSNATCCTLPALLDRRRSGWPSRRQPRMGRRVRRRAPHPRRPAARSPRVRRCEER